MKKPKPAKVNIAGQILHNIFRIPLLLRWLLVLLALGGFGYSFLMARIGLSYATIALASMLAAFGGLLLGVGGGIFTALAVVALDLFLQTGGNPAALLTAFDRETIIQLVTLVAAGILVGLLRTIALQTQRELAVRRRNELALRDSEQRFRTMSDLTHNWEAWLDPTGRLVYTSPSIERFTGYTAEQYAKNPNLLWDLTLEADRPTLEMHFKISEAEAPMHQVDIRIRHANGNIVWLRHICQPVYDSRGKFQGRRASNLDITEIKHANEELQHRLSLEQMLFEISNRLMDAAENGFAGKISETLQTVAGYVGADRAFLPTFRPGTLVIQDLYQWTGAGRDLDGILLGLDISAFPWITGLIRAGEIMRVASLDDLPAEAEAERSQWQATGALSVLAIPLISDNQPIGFFGFSTHNQQHDWQENDISALHLLSDIYTNLLDRMRIRTELVNSEARFRSTYENAGFGIVLVDNASTILDANTLLCQMFGYAREELIGRITDEITHPEDRQQDRAMVLEMIQKGGSNAQRELRYLRKDGSMFWGRLTISLVWGQQGKNVYGIGILEDITEQRRIAAELHSRERILEAVGLAAEDLLRMPDWDKGLQRALLALGSASQAGHVTIYQVENASDEFFFLQPVSFWSNDGQDFRAKFHLDEMVIRAPRQSVTAIQLLENHILNIQRDDFPPQMSGLVEKMNIAGMLVVPIYVENRVWGFISFDSDKQAVWSKAEEEGLKIAADVFGAAFQRRQVEQQIEQLYRAEHDQRQMAEALRDTAEILNASLNLQEVFDQVLANVEKVVPMDAANIMVIEEDVARVVGARGYQERGLQDYVMNLRFQIKNFPGFAYMFEEGRPTINFLSGSRDTWGIDRSFDWIQSFASAPIRQDGKTVGFLNIDSVMPDRYTQAHADRLQVFADQAALAIRNARLLEDARRRAQQIALLNQMAQAAISAATQSEMLDHMVNSLAALFEANSAAILLFENGEPYPSVGAIMGGRPVLNGQIAGPELDGFARVEQPMQIDDLSTRPDVKSAAALLYPCRALLALPMVLEEQRLGVVLIGFQEPHRISPAEVTLGEQATLQVALGINKNQLLEAERTRARQLARATDLFAALDHVATRIGAAADTSGVIHTLETELSQLGLAYGIILDDPATGELQLQYYSFRTHPDWRNRHEKIVHMVNNEKVRQTFYTDQAAYYIPDPILQIYGLQDLIDSETLHELVRLANFTQQTRLFLLPLVVKERVIGLLAVWGNLFESDRTVMSTFASQLAVAFYNASLYEQIQRVAITDEMTGLFNRRGMHEFGEREVERSRRFERPLSALMIDLDLFSRVNNTYGHLVGDEVLRQLADRVRCNIRELDVAVRFGGEEFLILLVETDGQAALAVAERIRAAIAGAPFETSAGSLHITASIGVAQMTPDMTGITHLIAHADQALYFAKQTGRNRVAAG
ncbi:MAG: diguanylate cyclase [Chloroflexi bacterium]|nr:diguanylate cyclase [Chloroflexota bacterium]